MFTSLDFVYLPSRDVAADVAHYVDRLDAELVFAIEAFGTRVAMVRLSDGGPRLLLAGHLEGEQPVLVFRVEDLEETVASLAQRGAEVGVRFGIPHGPGVEVVLRGPQRLALYQLTRPEAEHKLGGRRDF